MTLVGVGVPDGARQRDVAQRDDQGAAGRRGLQPLLQRRTRTCRPCTSCARGPDARRSTRGATAQLPLNAWTHLAATHDGTTLRLYVNGVQVGSRPVAGALLTSTGALRIGGNSIWGEFFQGRIDEVRIYNRALSAAELQTDMNTPLPIDRRRRSSPSSPALAGRCISRSVRAATSSTRTSTAARSGAIVFNGANNPPVAAIQATPTSGAAPLSVQFSAAGSSDPDGDGAHVLLGPERRRCLRRLDAGQPGIHLHRGGLVPGAATRHRQPGRVQHDRGDDRRGHPSGRDHQHAVRRAHVEGRRPDQLLGQRHRRRGWNACRPPR